MSHEITRRDLLQTAGVAGAAAGMAGLGLPSWMQEALAAKPKAGALTDVEHVVIFMQENRSFDHYFGTFPGVRGFSDSQGAAAFNQHGFPAGTDGVLQPWHLDISAPGMDCTHDVTHEWGPQHRIWNGGAMDKWVAEHLATDGADQGSLTMGYYDRKDVPLYHALADAFTICDRYHCSVIGPTDPNRLYSMSATLDPGGAHGGPLLETLVANRDTFAGKFTWKTMPEALSAKGITWKVYTSPQGGAFDNVLPYFKSFANSRKLQALGTKPTYPADFVSDVHKGKLPQVSWVVASVGESEHPAFSGPSLGEGAARTVVSTLMKKKSLWAKTALFVTWDENGGFFDHVAPPVPPAGSAGEFITVSPLPDIAQGINGPIGLGFRVPMLVISPFSRGGFVSSDVFDHTSTLRFLETRFGVKVPNLSKWRRSHTGDLTSAFNFVSPNVSVPSLPAAVTSGGPQNNCFDKTPITPPANAMPKQEPGKAKRPHGLKGARKG